MATGNSRSDSQILAGQISKLPKNRISAMAVGLSPSAQGLDEKVAEADAEGVIGVGVVVEQADCQLARVLGVDHSEDGLGDVGHRFV